MKQLEQYILEKFKITRNGNKQLEVTGDNIGSRLLEFLGIDYDCDNGKFLDEINNWIYKHKVKSGKILVSKEQYYKAEKDGCPDFILSYFNIIDDDKFNFYKKDYNRLKEKGQFIGKEFGFTIKSTSNYLIITADNALKIIFIITSTKSGEV